MDRWFAFPVDFVSLMIAKWQLVNLKARCHHHLYFSRTLDFPEYAGRDVIGRPALQPYEGLAGSWHEYANPFQRNYADFLAALAKIDGQKLHAVLDLACGTGIQSEALTQVADEVVGVDASEHMLLKAKERFAYCPSVRFLQGDFRTFRIDRQVDAAVCACNSINYVAGVTELREVFRRVAECLRPGGRFVFDSITESGMDRAEDLYLHVEIPERRFVILFSYDRAERKETSVAFMPEGNEIHCRVPIDPKVAEEACHESGLVMEDCFSNALLPARWYTGGICFFVLRKR